MNMKRLWIFIVPFLVTACQAQTADNNVENPDLSATVNKPKVEVKVNKEYDENGNLIRYDSAYVWSYTNTLGDSGYVNIDSLMLQFRPFMQDHFQMTFPDIEQDWMRNDSLFFHQFLGPDYFMDRWQNELERMNRRIREMDSLKSLFLDEYYPGLMRKQKLN